MQKLKLYWKEIAIVILMVAFLLSTRSCQEAQNLADNQLSAMNDTVKYFKNKLGTETATKEILQLTNKQFQEQILERDANFKALAKEFSRIKSTQVITGGFRIDSIAVPYEVKIPCDFERIGKYEDKFLKFDYKSNQDGFSFSNFDAPNTQYVINGFKRKWFLGRQIMTTDVTNSNEYFKTNNVKTIEIYVPKPFYDTRAFNIGIGIIGGALLFK